MPHLKISYIVDTGTTTAQDRFANSKSISSDQYFNRESRESNNVKRFNVFLFTSDTRTAVVVISIDSLVQELFPVMIISEEHPRKEVVRSLNN